MIGLANLIGIPCCKTYLAYFLRIYEILKKLKTKLAAISKRSRKIEPNFQRCAK